MGLCTRPEPGQLIIEYLPLDQLIADPNNTRVHTKAHVRAIMKAVNSFGFGVPMIIDAANKILSGHGRALACRKLGITEVPVVRLSHLSEAQARAFQIADNRLTELGGWDEIKLAETLRDLSLQDLDFDLDAIGFHMAEIDLKIQGLTIVEETADPDDAPTPKGPAVCQPGDLWILGRHRLLCGDALRAESYDALMGAERAAVVVTDPPYNVAIQGHVGGRGRIKHREFLMASSEMSRSEFTAFLTKALGHCAERSQPGALNYVCMDWRHMLELLSAGEACYSELKNLCVWAKTSPGQGAFYRSQHELVAVFKAGQAASTNNIQLGRFGRNRSNLWSYPSPASFGHVGEEGSLLAEHPTPKPVAMIADVLLDASNRGDVVLDPFLGGGATLIAAERVGRACRGLELDPLFVDVALRRFLRLTGLDPVREADGASFAALEAERQS